MLANAVCQPFKCRLTHRIREQARSHKENAQCRKFSKGTNNKGRIFIRPLRVRLVLRFFFVCGGIQRLIASRIVDIGTERAVERHVILAFQLLAFDFRRLLDPLQPY
ncbi:hypothetical protein PHLH5_15570 [Pseudomonas sp. Cab53]|nr:hypothetical protein PHLH5_15570 [Pseudomonas sp. Cab53]